MTEELQQEVIKHGIIPEEQQTTSDPEKVTASEQQSTPPTSAIEDKKALNFRRMRERIEQVERENLEYKRRLATPVYEQKQIQPVASPEIDEYDNIPDEELIEARHFKKLKREVKEIKNQISSVSSTAQHASVSTGVTELRQKFSDYDQIMTSANLDMLEKLYPEEAEAILYHPNKVAQRQMAYNRIKQFGINESYNDVDERLAQNRDKPKTAASVGAKSSESPLGSVDNYGRRTLTEADKERIRRQVAAAKMYR